MAAETEVVVKAPRRRSRPCAHEGSYSLLTDVVMPQIGVRATSEAFRQRGPQTRVLFMSGNTDDTIVHHGVLDSKVAFLHEPFTAEQLARRIRDVLEGP